MGETPTATATATATGTVGAPTLVSADVATNGTTLTLHFNVATKAGAGCGDWDTALLITNGELLVHGADAFPVCVSGDNSTAIVWTTDNGSGGAITAGQDLILVFDTGGSGPFNCIEASSGGIDWAGVTNFAVTNNSTQ